MGMINRRVVNLVVSLSLATQSLWPAIAAAHTKDLDARIIEQTEAMAKLVRDADAVPAGQPRGSYGPDRFLLLEQQAVGRDFVGRSFSLFSNRIEREFDEHRSRLQSARSVHEKILGFQGAVDRKSTGNCTDGDPTLSEATVLSQLLKHIDEGRRQDTPLFVWDVKDQPARLACVEERVRAIIQDWNFQITSAWENHEQMLDVPNITQAKLKHDQRLYNWWDVEVSVLSNEESAGGSVVAYFDLHKTADGNSIKADQAAYTCENGESCRFNIKSGTRILNKFHLPAQSVAALGPYLAFIHTNSYDADQGIQYISFIDLSAYSPAIGNSDMPVFRLPILLPQAAKSLSVANRKLMVDGQAVPIDAFVAASEMQQMAFNITANLVDPESIANTLPYIDGLQSVAKKIMATELGDAAGEGTAVKGAQVLFDKLGQDLKGEILKNKSIADLATGKRIEVGEKEAKELPDFTKDLLKMYSAGFEKSDVLSKRASVIAERMANSRTVKARFQAFFNRLTSPTPNASLKIKRGLVLVGASSEVNRGQFLRFLLDRPWLQTSVFIAGMTAYVAPDAFTDMAQQGLSVGAAIFDYLKFALLGVSEAVVKGTHATFGPFVDLGSAFSKQYVADGNWWRTLVGVSAFVPFCLSLFFVPHTLFNLHRIFLDSRKPEWKGFVDHQRKFLKEYYERLAEDEGRRRNMTADGTAVTFTEEEESEIRQFLKERTETSPAFEGAEKGMIGSAFSKIKASFAKLKKAVTGSQAVKEAGEDPTHVSGLWSALMSISFSYPAMELTLSRWAKAWNWFSGTRYTSFGFLTLKDIGLKYNLPIFLRPKPISMAVRMAYPDFFTTVVAKGDKSQKGKGPKLTIPTQLNGGLRSWELRDLVGLKETLFGKPAAVIEAEQEAQIELALSEMKVLTEEFETKILTVEREVMKEALSAAIRRLPDYIADKKELAEIFKQQPLKGIVDRKIQEMPVRVRTFLRLYFDAIYAKTMQEYLTNLVSEDLPEEGQGPAQMSLGELKTAMLDMRVGRKAAFDFDTQAARAIAEKYGNDEDIYQEVSSRAKRGEFSPTNWLTNRKYNVISDMDPDQNPSMKRYAVVQERMQSPNALSRAVRAEISKLLITFPLNLFLKLVMSAGIFEGMFKPIQEEFWGPTSVFYLSSPTFYMLMASGFVIGMMADAWYKLQQDARQDELGDFGQVPMGEDATKSFTQWYYKQFTAKNNSLMANWSFMNRLIFWNFPAAMVNMGFFYWLFSGRLDLSFMLGGYAIAFGTPLSAFGMKVDQAFERASEYAARGIKDEKWLSHPDVQEVVAKEKQFLRNRFQLLNDILINVQTNFTSNVEVIPTSLGPRGFVRALLGGSLIEETVVNKLLIPAKAATANIPGVNRVVDVVASGCEYLLTNGNKDLRGIGGGH